MDVWAYRPAPMLSPAALASTPPVASASLAVCQVAKPRVNCCTWTFYPGPTPSLGLLWPDVASSSARWALIRSQCHAYPVRCAPAREERVACARSRAILCVGKSRGSDPVCLGAKVSLPGGRGT